MLPISTVQKFSAQELGSLLRPGVRIDSKIKSWSSIGGKAPPIFSEQTPTPVLQGVSVMLGRVLPPSKTSDPPSLKLSNEQDSKADA
jgi:hypothetical protein